MKSTVATLFILGLVLGAISVLIVFNSWPSTELVSEGYTSSFSSALDVEPVYEDSGSWFAVFLGGLLGLASQIMIAAGTIAIGVHVGLADRLKDRLPAI